MATTKVTSSDLLEFNDSTGAVRLPVGTTAQRPGSANNADLRFNTDTSLVEYYDGSAWRELDSYDPTAVSSYLIVAGGGSGGAGYGAAGGGAGGYRNSYSTEPSGGNSPTESPFLLKTGVTYTITVGACGAAIPSGPVGHQNGNKGADSLISGSNITTITSEGGGSGGCSICNGGDGGSGGGSGRVSGNIPGVATAGQGFNGTPRWSSGGSGGGGAGSTGSNVSSPGNYRANGGDGLASSITGTSIYRAGGAAGINDFNTPGTGTGGLGGGANATASYPPGLQGNSGTPNTGGGGTGRNSHPTQNEPAGGAGGSGVVILRMATSLYSGITTGSPTVTTDGSDTILVYNGSGTYTH